MSASSLPFGGSSLRGRVALLYLGLGAANIGAWLWAWAAFHTHPALLATSAVAYGLGLRHAVDADHIAAIDNVTRKLMQEGQRPVGVGVYFSIGHSTVVVLTCVAIALTATLLQGRFEQFKSIGSVVGTLVSGVFLLAIAAMNSVICVDLWRDFRHALTPGAHGPGTGAVFTGGVIARMFRPVFKLVSRSWHMYPLGFLFGLGFDTATEIGLLGLSAASATKGLSIWCILVFPALFASAMSLVDATDGILMLGAYGWAFVRPLRKLYYNLVITVLSVVVAAVIGGIEVLGLVAGQLSLTGRCWSTIARLSGNLDGVGLFVILVCLGTWIGSMAVYRA